VPKQYKIDAVDEMKERLGRTKALVITDYRGLTVSEMTDLRARLRKEGVEYKIVKNRLAKIALKESGMNTMDDYLKGMTALAFGVHDAVGPAKVLTGFAKDNTKLKVLAGLMENEVLDVPALQELASTPPREVLLGRLLGSLQSPVQNVVYCLNQAVSGVVLAVDALARKKEEAGA
jgi:large subunit ribosomal protein L10